MLRNVLGTSAVALPQVPKESQFETAVGTAVKNLFADAASGKPVSAATVKAAVVQRPAADAGLKAAS